MIISKRAVQTAVAVACAVFGLAGPASASTAGANACTSGNSCASISGLTGHAAANNNGADCAYKNLCLYTGTNYTGTRYDLYSCKTYYLLKWYGNGSYVNNETANAVANYYDENGGYLHSDVPGMKSGQMDYSPVWSVRNC
ncbi:peptidase inhibitor family I36 protein [Streptomyces bauhiniae]